MSSSKTSSQMRRGLIEFCVLSRIGQGEIYSSELIEGLREAGLIVTEGTIYPLLSRLSKNGLLAHRWETSESGPPRKYYALTPAGAALQADLLGTWRDLVRAVDHLTAA